MRGNSVVSLPVPSELARKRNVSTNPPSVGQKSLKGGSACTRLKSVSPQDRVREFADDSLCVSAGKLFCRVCREQLSMKRSVVKNHVQSMKHKSSKGRLKEEKHDTLWMLRRDTASSSIQKERHCLTTLMCILSKWFGCS